MDKVSLITIRMWQIKAFENVSQVRLKKGSPFGKGAVSMWERGVEM
jgi:hypothetical protein